MERTIGIVGGGIGGIAAAVALHQSGHSVVVYERAAELREVGAGMMLWPNATRVLRELGLLERALACGGLNTNFLVRSEGGKILLDLALGEFDVPAFCIRRSDLLQVLLSALPPECIQLGREFQRWEQAGDRVRLHFGDGLVEEHDALIGADGIRSRVRAGLSGADAPVYRGYTVWRGLAPYAGHAVPLGCNSETWGVGQRFGILHTGPQRYTWYATLNVSPDHVDAAGGRKHELLELFKGWHEPVADLIEATPEDAILKHKACDVAPLRRWGVGRVTLLGDAAHTCTPNLGQGGGMALEDALVLAKCVTRERPLPQAFREYERRRLGRTRHIQKRSRWMGWIGQWDHPLLVAGRRTVTSLLPSRLIERSMRRTYAYTT